MPHALWWVESDWYFTDLELNWIEKICGEQKQEDGKRTPFGIQPKGWWGDYSF